MTVWETIRVYTWGEFVFDSDYSIQEGDAETHGY